MLSWVIEATIKQRTQSETIQTYVDASECSRKIHLYAPSCFLN